MTLFVFYIQAARSTPFLPVTEIRQYDPLHACRVWSWLHFRYS